MKTKTLILFGAVFALLAMRPAADRDGRSGTFSSPAPAASEGQETTAPGAVALTYEGSDLCLGCHGEKEGNLTGTGHGSGFFGELSAHGCETCHGPGSAHIEDPENVSLRLDRLSPEEQAATCQQCHSGGEQFFWKGSVHDSRELSCIDCHTIHSPKSPDKQLKTATVAETCYGCHKDIRAQMWKRSHHPVREGQISCTDCHNPHGSQTDKLIRAASVNDQCYSCHTEKRGPFIWDHPPVRESCLTCHTPHGSNHQKLQVVAAPFLCQQCHANTRHPSTLYDADQLPTGSSPVNRMFNRACLNCHQAIHGSNHPSAPYLAH